MRYLRSYFALFLFIVTIECQPTLCFAQLPVMDGYAVTNDRDTIPGKLEYVSRVLAENKLVFIEHQSVKISVLRPSAISGLYAYSGIAFESKELDGRRIFLRLLSRGRVNLYSDGKDLFLSDGPLKVMRLRGGTQTVIIEGKPHAQKVNSYKAQLISQIESSFHVKIRSLPFEQKAVLNLIREVNKDLTDTSKPRLDNHGYFSVDAGYSLNMMKKLSEADDDLNNHTRHRTMSWMMGLRYKRKILNTRSHIGVGLHYEHTPSIRVGERKFLHSSITVPADGGPSYPSDTTGSQLDVYSYKLNSIDLSIGFIPEVSNGRFRPFLDIGMASKFYLNSDATFKRNSYDKSGALADETQTPMQLRSLILGPKLGSGCRLILDMNRSLSAGFNVELFWLSTHLDAAKIVAKQFYLSYGL